MVNRLNESVVNPRYHGIQASPVHITMSKDVVYSGISSEDYDEWLLRVNECAAAEGWGNDDRRRAAVSTLRGNARKWHLDFGIGLNDWDAWEAALNRYFVEPMDEIEWKFKMEARIQQVGKATKDYLVQKNYLFRKHPRAPLPEPEKIPFFIRGLRSPDVRAVMLTIKPQTMDDFVRIFYEKERAMRSSITPGVLAALRPAVMAETKPLLDPVLALSHNVGRIMKEVNNLTATMASWPGVAQQQHGGTPRPSGGAVIRSRNASGSEIPEVDSPRLTGANASPLGNTATRYRPQLPPNQRSPGNLRTQGEDRLTGSCLNCGQEGHWRRNCPLRVVKEER